MGTVIAKRGGNSINDEDYLSCEAVLSGKPNLAKSRTS
jgi:hypothetical protein